MKRGPWRWLGRSLYWRIAAVYLLLLVGLGVFSAWVTVQQFDRFGMELEQRLNRKLADNLAMVLEGALVQGPGSQAAQRAAAEISAINPSLGLFILDSRGGVVTAYGHEDCPMASRVDLNAVTAFLEQSRSLPILGTAPCGGGRKVFSVTHLAWGGHSGYLYVILHGQPYESIAAMLQQSYLARSLAVTGVVALAMAGCIGLLWFAFLTRRLGSLTQRVQRFQAGEPDPGMGEHRDDEIGRLGRAFDEMAATIAAQVHALQETDRLRRELVANVSHDFRTPLTSLRGFTERVLAKLPGLSLEQIEENLHAILLNAGRLEHLADQLSVLSRLDYHGPGIDAEPFSLAELGQDIVLKFMPEARRRGVNLRVEGPRELPPVFADIGLIERVISNLIDNALRATSADGEVCLRLRPDDRTVEVSVIDTGCGIPEEEHAHVLQRFCRTRRSELDHTEGSGLGLAIAREILELHGVSLRLVSRPGQGTTITFELSTVAAGYSSG